jgi:CheY-like chemotaxis protein
MTDPSELAGLRVLLIEDEVVIAMTAEDMLEEIGCLVTAQATNFNEALDNASRDNFDLALLDVNLNGVMSLPVARLLREKGKPFIFTTGYGNVGLESEFSDIIVVSKPYTIRTLENAIQTATR